MDTVIDNIARAIRKLAAAGVGYAVVAADHGHLFFATDRDESMRTDPPGGYTVESAPTRLDRSRWCDTAGLRPSRGVGPRIRLRSRTSLPSRFGGLQAGGDLAYHHGGPTLQEMVIPVITIRTAASEAARTDAASPSRRRASGDHYEPDLQCHLVVGSGQMMLERQQGPCAHAHVRRQPGRRGGHGGRAEFDRGYRTHPVEPGQSATVGFQLTDDTADSSGSSCWIRQRTRNYTGRRRKIPVRLGVYER